jgi:hypothetical protein
MSAVIPGRCALRQASLVEVKDRPDHDQWIVATPKEDLRRYCDIAERVGRA